MRLHLCCGGVYLEGFQYRQVPYEEGDDSRSGCVADLMADVFDLPFESSSVTEIVMCRGLEHFYRFEGEKLLEYFSELLNAGGVLYLEMPSRNRVFLLCLWERLIALPLRRSSFRLEEDWPHPLFGVINGRDLIMRPINIFGRVQSYRNLQSSLVSITAVISFTSSHIPFRDMGIALERR